MGTTFNVTKDSLQPTERLRIKNGELIQELSTKRSSSNWFHRRWTRKQYRSSALLNKMSAAATQALTFQSATPQFIENYETLIKRIQAKNTTYRSRCCLVRFFKGNKIIDLTTHEKNVQALKDSRERKPAQNKPKIEEAPPQNTTPPENTKQEERPLDYIDWADEVDSPDDLIDSYIGLLGLPNVETLLFQVNPKKLYVEQDKTTYKDLIAMLNGIGIVKVEDVYRFETRSAFQAYLVTNREQFTEIFLSFPHVSMRLNEQ